MRDSIEQTSADTVEEVEQFGLLSALALLDFISCTGYASLA